MADYDGIWKRGGVNVEELPDPFAPQPPPPTPPGPEAEEPTRPKQWGRGKIAALVTFGVLFLTLLWLVLTAPLSRALEPLPDPAMLFLSQEGRPIARRGAIKEAPVDAAKLDKLTTAAFVSVEDRRFYRHWGVDPRGIGRAMMANLRAGGVREGGSTITQQLAKTSFLSSDRSLKRKAQEVIIAFWLEAWLTKDEILSRYLSSVYFGDGVYGLRAASDHYFDRKPENLNLAQSAMLAGLVQAPSRLAPTKHLKAAQNRSRIVLKTMASTGAITEQRARNAKLARPVRQSEKIPSGTYFSDWVVPQAQDSFASEFGLVRVPTTLDSDLQRIAVRTVTRGGIGDAQAALVAMRPDGRVVAMVGGKSYKDTPFNRSTQALRQPGSAFKLFVYLAALRAGWTPDSIIEDEPITISGWTPANSDGVYRGKMTLREAFARSSNAATVRLSERVGRANVIRAARDLGISSTLPDKPSLALGTGGVRLIELTAAYAAIYYGRYPIEPRGLLEPPPQASGFAGMFAPGGELAANRERAPMLDLLWAATNSGTGKRAALRVPTFGKTGTTQDNRDALFIGFAGNLVVGVWVGRDDDSSLGKVTGGTAPAKIWRNFMASALAIDGQRGPPLPANYRNRPGRDAPADDSRQSPLPEDWSESTRKLREIADALREMFEK
ncbi:transglycosylase domain-containing protein [Sphingomonas sabuli]|uniref:Transglycosylase domain-containing protein n=1 Tax=Sphingomonas sabuli TaxID=2764186 RepID=A0A7G9L4R8_9SPHN|nr:transglycosylase domain-containing protein [Sphingomonas sabuli]QNM83617.1 transglycosylase domain-containing protein [Sphingomonas sabuli]